MNKDQQLADRWMSVAVGSLASLVDALRSAREPQALIEAFMESWYDDIDQCALFFFQYLPHHSYLVLTRAVGLNQRDWPRNQNIIDLKKCGGENEDSVLESLLQSKLPSVLAEFFTGKVAFTSAQVFPVVEQRCGEKIFHGAFVSVGSQGIGSGAGFLYWHLFNLHYQNALMIKRAFSEIKTDHITGLLTKKAFLQKIDEELSRSRRIFQPLSLVIYELNDYAKFRAARGEAAANQMLIWFGFLLRKTSRPSDVIAHLGNGQFASLLPHTSKKGAVAKAEQLRHRVRKSRLFTVTISSGVSEYPTLAEDAESLVRTAHETVIGLRKLDENRGHDSVGVSKVPLWLRPDFNVAELSESEASP